ncbi:MAG: transposase [Oligoflexia bacterium]|nr:transposase [Oligoflexia bacterium]
MFYLIKYSIDGEVYVCATTLVSTDYNVNDFAKLYHGRWGIEELYKISKEFIDVEDFHSRTERGVKQEVYAHLLLINIARIFEAEAKDDLLPLNTIDKPTELKNSYWQGFCEKLQEIKINFKNCLLVVGRFLERFLLGKQLMINDWVPKVIASIKRIRYRIRFGRHYPRRSFKPGKKWMRATAVA